MCNFNTPRKSFFTIPIHPAYGSSLSTIAYAKLWTERVHEQRLYSLCTTPMRSLRRVHHNTVTGLASQIHLRNLQHKIILCAENINMCRSFVSLRCIVSARISFLEGILTLISSEAPDEAGRFWKPEFCEIPKAELPKGQRESSVSFYKLFA